jgi:hypothetical protein
VDPATGTPPPPPPRRRGLWLILAGVLGGAVLAGGAALLVLQLSGNEEGGTRRSGDAENAEAAEAQLIHDVCVEEFTPLLNQLRELDSRLSVGLTFPEYSEHVGDIRVEYDRIPIDDLDFNCVQRVGIPAENALNHYVDAHNEWNDCIQDLGCDTDSIDPSLQASWLDATQEIERAEGGFEELLPSPGA